MLDKKQCFIREHVGVLKLKDAFDILDPETGKQIGLAKETTPGWALALRFLVKKHLLPVRVAIRENEQSPPLIEIRRGFTLLRSKVFVHDRGGTKIGYFKSKLFSLGGGFYVYDTQDHLVAEIKGDWKGWNFKFIDSNGRELGLVTKKWAGLGKELFTTADNYLISINEGVEKQPGRNALLLAAGIAIDIVFKE